jgi:hypothetical protein
MFFRRPALESPTLVVALAGRRSRCAVRPDGLAVIMDEAVADEFVAPGDPVEQVMYGYSTMICRPDGRSSTPSEGTGTVMRRSTLTDYATRAGFTSAEVVPIQDFAFFRFYRLLY